MKSLVCWKVFSFDTLSAGAWWAETFETSCIHTTGLFLSLQRGSWPLLRSTNSKYCAFVSFRGLCPYIEPWRLQVFFTTTAGWFCFWLHLLNLGDVTYDSQKCRAATRVSSMIKPDVDLKCASLLYLGHHISSEADASP